MDSALLTAAVFPPASSPTHPAAKKEGEQLFDAFVAQDLNERLKELMEGLSVKVGCWAALLLRLHSLASQPVSRRIQRRLPTSLTDSLSY